MVDVPPKGGRKHPDQDYIHVDTKNILFILSLIHIQERPDPSYFAGIAAKGYYDLLLEGKYEEYVAGFHQPCLLYTSRCV